MTSATVLLAFGLSCAFVGAAHVRHVPMLARENMLNLAVALENAAEPQEAVTLRSEGAGKALSKADADRLEAAKHRPDIFLISTGACCVGAVIVMIYGASHIATRVASEDMKELVDYSFNVTLCFWTLCLIFVLYGIVQEYIMTQTFNGLLFPSSAFLVAANRLLTVFVVVGVLLYKRESFAPVGARWTAIPAATLFISSWCQYSSLRYVSFPTQMMFKNSKIVPTMAMGTIINGQSFVWKDYVMALLITIFVAGFSIMMEAGDDARTTAVYGVILMLIFLVADALTSNGEKRVFNTYPGFSNTQMVWMMAIFSVLYSVVAIQFEHGYQQMYVFLMANPRIWFHITVLSICSTAGQFMIFYIIKKHGPVLFAIMMTVRQIFSIMFSAILFGHELPWLAVACAVGVFAVLFTQSAMKLLSAHQMKSAKGGEKKEAMAGDAGKKTKDQV